MCTINDGMGRMEITLGRQAMSNDEHLYHQDHSGDFEIWERFASKFPLSRHRRMLIESVNIQLRVITFRIL